MHGMNRPLVCIGVLLAVATTVPAQQTTASGVHPISGRRYATVMGFEGADWLERAEREDEEEPERALDALELKKGDTVADIGAGSGYITARIAKRVGPTGRVYAEDIQPEMLALLQQRIARQQLTNVTPVLGLFDDPKLPASAIDVELLVDVYHEFSEPQQMLRGLRTALKPG